MILQSRHKNDCSPKLAGIPDLGRATEPGAFILHRRSWDSPISSSSALYILLGILITLVISTPLLGLLRLRQRQVLQERTRALQTAEGNVQASQTELNSLRNIRQTLTEEHCQWRENNVALLQRELQDLDKAKRRVGVLERERESMEATMAGTNVAATRARAEIDDARATYESVSADVRRLEAQMREKDRDLVEQMLLKDEELASERRKYERLQGRYEFVNQEYLRIQHLNPSSMPDAI